MFVCPPTLWGSCWIFDYWIFQHDPPGDCEDGGDVETNPHLKYAIPSSVLLPKAGDGAGANLVVPVAVSASHVGYATLRMEPQFMVMGQAAGTLAALAVKAGGGSVRDVPAAALRKALLAAGAILDPPRGET